MANEKVKFLKGQSSQLPAKNTAGAAVAGAFYLTNDTHRLYVGDDSGYLQELNQSITTIADLDALNALTTSQVSDGQFYYVSGSLGNDGKSASGSNILVVANGTRTVDGQTKPAWVQINPDSFYQLTSSQAAVAVNPKSNKKIVVSTTVGEEKKGNAPGSAHTVTGSFTLEEGNNVTLTPTGNVIKIDVTDSTYDLKTNKNDKKGEVVLDGPGSSDDKVYFTGSNGIKVSSDNAGNVSIVGNTTVTAANAFDADGDFTTSISVNGGNAVASAAVTPTIQYGVTTPKQTATFKNGTAVLDVYTKDEVNQKITDELSVANALQYQGVVSNANFTTKTTGAKAGYTYKASDTITVPGGKTAKVGDLIIAEEDSNKNIVWEVVPSGDDQFITGSYAANNNYWELRDGSKSGNPILAAHKLNAGTAIALSSSVTDNILTTTISHGATSGGTAVTAGALTDSTTLGANYNSTLTIPVVTSITKDSFGHITAQTVQNYKFQHVAISDPTFTYIESGNTKAIGYNFNYGGKNVGAALNLKSDTIAFSNDSSALRADIVWGSFGSNS